MLRRDGSRDILLFIYAQTGSSFKNNCCDHIIMFSLPDSVLMNTTLFAVVVWLCVRFLYQPRMQRLVNKLPGPPGLPVIGNALALYVPHSELVPTVLKLIGIYGRNGVIRVWLGHRAFVGLYKSNWVEALLSSNTQISKAVEYDYMKPWLGTGLLTSTGEKWRSRRKLLTPAFHFRILEDFLDVYNEQSEILVQQLAKKVEKPEFDLFPMISYCTLDIICESAMGRNLNAQKNAGSEYVQAVKNVTDIIHSRQMRPWLWPDWLFALTEEGRMHNGCLKILHSFTEKVIRERREEWKIRGKRPTIEEDDVMGEKIRLAFLDLLLQASEDGRILNDLDIREEVDTFMFEGQDTTASALTSVLFLLGTHPEIQEKVQEELDTVLGDTNRKIKSDDLKELKYLDCCVKEALRLFPPVPMIARDLTDDITLDGQTIPSGVTLLVGTFVLHRDPHHFPNPEVFYPDRFLPANSRGRHPYAYVPFSAGPRNCIGQKFALMEEKVILAHVLRMYTIEAMEKIKPYDLKILAELILRPLNGLPIKLHQRKKQTDK